MTIRAVVFDFDGLILDTEWPLFVAWQETYRRHGGELTADEWSAIVGTVGHDPSEALKIVAAEPFDPATVREATWERARELIKGEAVLPGIETWLADAARLGLGIAVASSGSIEWVEGHLHRLELRHHFHAVRCHGEDLAAKPAPDLYLAAAAALGVDPTEAVAVEDSPTGIAAAKAAGLFCVAVPNRLTVGQDLSAADLLVASLADLALEDLVADSR
ncbi:MAG TPA: HAD-IA family hydrolase [Acidimicrobiales bacterium]|nr:HAD-IA family hydrolase [Acidimicrobiales bacterium]